MELGPKSDSSEPRPDIHDLFSHYNALYFDDALGACIVCWNDSRTARSAGMCCYLEEGFCEIRLSEPLLKFRSTADLKNTLLHEMIHAFLYITGNKKDHSYHGPSFIAKVNAINTSTITDPQRPLDGYNIKVSHDFSKDVEKNNVQGLNHCEFCGDTIEGAVNEQLSATACIENVDHNKSCRNLSCHSNRHKRPCSGRLRKAETPGDKGKLTTREDGQENPGDKSNGPSHMTRHSKRKFQNLDQMDSFNVKKTKSDASTSSGIKSLPCSARISQRKVTNKHAELSTQLTSIEELDAKVPKKPRTPRSKKHDRYDFVEKIEPAEKKNIGECTRRESPEANAWYDKYDDFVEKIELAEKKNLVERKKRNPPVATIWYTCYTDEESDEDVVPLVNNRTERRKREKLLKQQNERRIRDMKTVNGELSCCPVGDSVVYILDD